MDTPSNVPPQGSRRLSFLLSQAGEIAGRGFADRVAELGLSAADAGVLRTIGRNPGLSQRTLADELTTAPSRMVAVIDSLEARGLVQRSRNAADRRLYNLGLTVAGESALGALRGIAEDHEQQLIAGLSPEQAGDLQRLLTVLVESHHASAEIHPGTGEYHGGVGQEGPNRGKRPRRSPA